MGEPEIPEMRIGTIAELWRYPVKSLAAEPLAQASIDADGLRGDRTAALIVADREHARSGKPFRGKEHCLLHTVNGTEPARALAAAAGVDVSVVSGERYFDARPLSLLWDTWLRDVESLVDRRLDPLRYRPNVFVHAAAAFSGREGDLVGCALELGTARLRVVEPIHRCVTTTYDVLTGAGDPAILREVAQRRANTVGVYCTIERAGSATRGDAIVLLPEPAA